MPSSLQAISGLFGSSSPWYGFRSAQDSVGSAVMAAVSQAVQAVSSVPAGWVGLAGSLPAGQAGGGGSSGRRSGGGGA